MKQHKKILLVNFAVFVVCLFIVLNFERIIEVRKKGSEFLYSIKFFKSITESISELQEKNLDVCYWYEYDGEKRIKVLYVANKHWLIPIKVKTLGYREIPTDSLSSKGTEIVTYGVTYLLPRAHKEFRYHDITTHILSVNEIEFPGARRIKYYDHSTREKQKNKIVITDHRVDCLSYEENHWWTYAIDKPGRWVLIQDTLCWERTSQLFKTGPPDSYWWHRWVLVHLDSPTKPIVKKDDTIREIYTFKLPQGFYDFYKSDTLWIAGIIKTLLGIPISNLSVHSEDGIQWQLCDSCMFFAFPLLRQHEVSLSLQYFLEDFNTGTYLDHYLRRIDENIFQLKGYDRPIITAGVCQEKVMLPFSNFKNMGPIVTVLACYYIDIK